VASIGRFVDRISLYTPTATRSLSAGCPTEWCWQPF